MTCRMQKSGRRWLAAAVIFLACIHCHAAQVATNTVISTYGATCHTTDVLEPTSTEQLAKAIKAYARTAAKQPVHIRATHKYYHSTASFPCAAATAGKDDLSTGKSTATTVNILMQRMDRLVAADKAAQTITVQAGMAVSSMIEAAKQQGLAVPLMAVPNYGGLTLGGIMATAATGTGTAGSPSALCDIVTNIQWVDGKGEVHTSERRSPQGKAICGGLGVIGVVTQVKLQLEKPGKVFVRTHARVADTQLLSDIEAMQKVTPHVTVTWRPDLGKYTAHMFTPSALPDPVNATIYQVDRPESDAVLLSQALKDWQNDVHGVNHLLNSAMCQFVVPMSSVDVFWAVDEETNKGAEYALADANSILSSACNGGPDGSCSLMTVGHIGVKDIHFSIDQSKLGEWIADVKEVIDKDLHHSGAGFLDELLHKNKRECLPPGYFWLRFGNPTDDYVALNSAPYKQPVHVQLSLFENRQRDVAPLKHGHVLAILEQLTLCRYRGRPHFGKNFDRTFTYSKCPLADRYPRWTDWTSAAKQHDPQGLFASPLVGSVLHNGMYMLSVALEIRHAAQQMYQHVHANKHKTMPHGWQPGWANRTVLVLVLVHCVMKQHICV
ncbi:hypothetical protein COO60DRAFT_701031 [Scenedesmus sp. NREL 46B-D3]|nr:hypothetical protein COO60DRAFT_701031 [Scenedesmus sp. NREL 46B-D3]